MSKEKRDPPESSSESGPNQTFAVKIELSGTAAGLLEFLRSARLRKLLVHDGSIAVPGTSGSLHHREGFQRCSNDAGVKAFTPANVRLAAVNRRDDFPHPRAIGEEYNVVLLNSRALHHEPLATKRRPPGG
jgi:hypothetical protein